MGKRRILVVDDEHDLCEILCYNLTTAGYQPEAVCSAEEAQEKIANCKLSNGKCYDLILLDVMMPGISGFELAQQLKADEGTAGIPIIFLTAKDTEEDMLHGFGIGADDYVKKPFSVREVTARVKAVLNRNVPHSTRNRTDVMSYEGLVIDHDKKSVTVDGVLVALTKTELELLSLLLEHRGQVFSRQQVINKVWPMDVIVSDRAVDVNITRIRKKIGRYGQYVVTRQGFGYVFEEVEKAKS